MADRHSVEPSRDPERNAAYLEASKFASQQLKEGEIKAFSTTFDHEAGREIHVETDQGWNPAPIYQDYPPETDQTADY